ncbi:MULTISPECIES: GGDEF domain-containing protein [unclassified Caballeronia]|uniref:GGDEF domain-containing protein n=1 Tax=unclassified Caballeronia TaxID=2646786 RepID=UPI002028B6C2|nr:MULTISPECIES: GGDEF domain-containing protein [unclassified Caballeronia]MDR5770110.1 GGDEF domain-containing protein [Caballeronia sp. LZ028]
MKRLNEYDSLTGLLNRATLGRRMHERLAEAQANNTRFSLLFIDLDDFKTVNDSLGHQFGDELLATVASRLERSVGATEEIGRYGGDEFIIASRLPTLEAVERLAFRIIEAVNLPILTSGGNLYPRLSVGISSFPEHGQEADSLLTKADAAMYRAKKGGRNRYATYENKAQTTT